MIKTQLRHYNDRVHPFALAPSQVPLVTRREQNGTDEATLEANGGKRKKRAPEDDAQPPQPKKVKGRGKGRGKGKSVSDGSSPTKTSPMKRPSTSRRTMTPKKMKTTPKASPKSRAAKAKASSKSKPGKKTKKQNLGGEMDSNRGGGTFVEIPSRPPSLQ